MFSRDKIAIEIGSVQIKILVGNKNRVKVSDKIKTPKDSVVDGKLKDIEAITSEISRFINEKNIKAKEVSYAISGQDILVRHLEVPIMDLKGIKTAVLYEIEQYLSDNIDNYFVDYEILDKVNENNKKLYKLIVVAVNKDRIRSYVSLTEKLGLQLLSIDIASNCMSRVVRKNKKLEQDSVGIIDFGGKSSSITILDKGRIFIQREVPFGMENVISELMILRNENSEEARKYLMKDIHLLELIEEEETHLKIKTLYENLFDIFSNIIQFYNTGRLDKSLKNIYIIGGGSDIRGIEEFTAKYISATTKVIDSPKKVDISINFPKEEDIKYHFNTLGLLMRKEN